MKVVKRVEEMVCPASPVGGGRVMGLSLCDRCMPSVYISLLLFFNEKPKLSVEVLMKASLAQALAVFYPCAGRLRRNSGNGELEIIECNDAGALLAQAWVDAPAYSHFLPPFLPHPDFSLFFPSAPHSDSAAADLPLLAQITYFKCGRICLGIQLHHNVCDGLAMSQFLSTWAMLTQSKVNADFEKEGPLHDVLQPQFDRSTLRPALPLPSSTVDRCQPTHPIFYPTCTRTIPKINDVERSPACTSKIFSFTPSDIDALRTSAAGRGGVSPMYTRFQILSAHLWRGIIHSRGRPAHDEEYTRLALAVDGRKRLNPPLPQGYFGNAIFLGFVETTEQQVVDNPLSFAADLMKDYIAEFSDAHMRSILDEMAKLDSPRSLYRSFLQASIPVFVNSWLRFSLYDLDFGWGKPSFARPPPIAVDGFIVLLPSPLGEGHVDALVSLQADHMPKLEEYIQVDAFKAN